MSDFNPSSIMLLPYRLLAETCVEIKKARGIELLPVGGFAAFGGSNPELDAAEEAARARRFDWRSEMFFNNAHKPYIRLSVTYREESGQQMQLWRRSPEIEKPELISFYTWALFAMLEADLAERKVEGFTPAHYEG